MDRLQPDEQELRHLYTAADLDRARRRLERVSWACATTDIPKLHRLGRTIAAWKTEILAYFPTGAVSNGPTEALNLLIKRIKRVGFGFRNFTTYRLRPLLYCGLTWQTPAATRIQGRSPRSMA